MSEQICPSCGNTYNPNLGCRVRSCSMYSGDYEDCEAVVPKIEPGSEAKSYKESFRDDLKSLLNKYCMENNSNTPDFVLADYLLRCLENWDQSINSRQDFFRRAKAEGLTLDDMLRGITR